MICASVARLNLAEQTTTNFSEPLLSAKVCLRHPLATDFFSNKESFSRIKQEHFCIKTRVPIGKEGGREEWMDEREDPNPLQAHHAVESKCCNSVKRSIRRPSPEAARAFATHFANDVGDYTTSILFGNGGGCGVHPPPPPPPKLPAFRASALLRASCRRKQCRNYLSAPASTPIIRALFCKLGERTPPLPSPPIPLPFLGRV